MTDERFAMNVREDPENALEEYNLSKEEQKAVQSQDDKNLWEQLSELTEIKAQTIIVVIVKKSPERD